MISILEPVERTVEVKDLYRNIAFNLGSIAFYYDLDIHEFFRDPRTSEIISGKYEVKRTSHFIVFRRFSILNNIGGKYFTPFLSCVFDKYVPIVKKLY